MCASNFLIMGNNCKVLKTFVKTLSPQNNPICNKTPTEINESTIPELTRPPQVTDMSDITVKNLWVKLSFKALSDDTMSQTRSFSFGKMCSRFSRK